MFPHTFFPSIYFTGTLFPPSIVISLSTFDHIITLTINRDLRELEVGNDLRELKVGVQNVR